MFNFFFQGVAFDQLYKSRYKKEPRDKKIMGITKTPAVFVDANPKDAKNAFQGAPALSILATKRKWGVSKNRGTPKWMVYNGNPY